MSGERRTNWHGMTWDNEKRRHLASAINRRLEELALLTLWVKAAVPADLEIELGHGALKEFADFEDQAADRAPFDPARYPRVARVVGRSPGGDGGDIPDAYAGYCGKCGNLTCTCIQEAAELRSVARAPKNLIPPSLNPPDDMDPGKVIPLEVPTVMTREQAVELFGRDLGGSIGNWLDYQRTRPLHVVPALDVCAKCTRCQDDHPHEDCEDFEPGTI